MHVIADHQAFSERTAVMRAFSSNGKKLRAATRQEHFFVAHLSLNHSAIGHFIDRHSAREIWCNNLDHIGLLGSVASPLRLENRSRGPA
jgi:hypothetical protein